jgi:predicted transposase YdaD
MEIITSWMEQGIERGERSLILRQLNRQVGEVPESVRSRVAALSISQLEELGEALLDFTSLADLEAWLAAVRE